MSGNTKCPVSGQELRMHRDKLQYTKHHLLRNIIRQQAAKAKVRSITCFVSLGSAPSPFNFFSVVARRLRKMVQAALCSIALSKQWNTLTVKQEQLRFIPY